VRTFDDVTEVGLGRSVAGLSPADLGRSGMDLGRNAGMSRDQLEQLCHDVRSGLNDALFTRLCNMEEVVALTVLLLLLLLFRPAVHIMPREFKN